MSAGQARPAMSSPVPASPAPASPAPASPAPASTRLATSRRRGRPGYDLESLLAVAVAVFNERGYDASSMEDLSRRLGIAKSSIYHHVDSKEELLSMALDRALDGLFSVAAQVQARDEPAVDRLEFLVRGSIGVLADRLPYVTLLLRARGNTATERRALERRRQFDQIVADLVREAEHAGDIRPDIDPAVTARLLFGMVNSVAEWFRPDAGAAAGANANPGGTGPGTEARGAAALADAACAMAFGGLRIRRAEPRQPGA